MSLASQAALLKYFLLEPLITHTGEFNFKEKAIEHLLYRMLTWVLSIQRF